ncbi:MAG: Asp23/Gls24 family envelope stress response protein, partial [Lysinibacillus sp.]
KKVHNKGIKSGVTDKGEISIDVFCTVKYGFSIPKVAKDVQTQIRHAIYNMTALETAEVNVHIPGLQFDQVAETAE